MALASRFVSVRNKDPQGILPHIGAAQRSKVDNLRSYADNIFALMSSAFNKA
jgi:hypothetical protein